MGVFFLSLSCQSLLLLHALNLPPWYRQSNPTVCATPTKAPQISKDMLILFCNRDKGQSMLGRLV